MSLFAEEVQSELDSVVSDSKSIICDDLLQKKLSEMSNNEKKTEEWLEGFRGVKERIEHFCFYNENIRYVYLRSEDGKSFGRFDNDQNQRILVRYEEQVINSAQGINGIFGYEVDDSASLLLKKILRSEPCLCRVGAWCRGWIPCSYRRE